MRNEGCAAYLVKRTCIIEAALPNLVYDPLRSGLVRTRWVGPDGDCSSAANARLCGRCSADPRVPSIVKINTHLKML